MDSKNELCIHFVGLTPKEAALFERVISFNATHGLKAKVIDELSDAELVIVAGETIESMELYKNKTVVVVSNDEAESQGDILLIRPLLITKAMSSLSEALNLIEQKAVAVSDTAETTETTAAEKVEEVVNNAIETMSEATSETNVVKNQEKKSGHHALIIDDSAAIRKQLELELRDAGISSDFAACGEDALEKITDNHFDLIFLDIIMPGIDGYETCQKMRADAAYKKTPIIMLSGKTAPLDEVKGVIAGATTYITKPVKSDKLQETLNRVTKWIENYAPPRKTEAV